MVTYPRVALEFGSRLSQGSRPGLPDCLSTGVLGFLVESIAIVTNCLGSLSLRLSNFYLARKFAETAPHKYREA